MLDGTLRQALAVQLEQSPFLNVLSDQKVGDTLKLMNHPLAEHLTEATAQEVCTRADARAVLAGSVSRSGDRYHIGLKTTDCRSGDTLASAQAEASDRGRLLGLFLALLELVKAKTIRAEQPEEFGQIWIFLAPPEERTTAEYPGTERQD